jgi:hypothetical protein
VLDHPQHSTEPEVRQTEALNDLNWRIYQLKTTCVDEHELEGQRWLVRGLVDSEFALKQHEASDAMSLVYGLSPVRSRQIHGRTLLEVRRQLLDVVELPAVTRANLIGTRGKALARYCDQLSPSDFSRLAFLMRGLSPTAVIPHRGAIRRVLDGFPALGRCFRASSGAE